MIDVLMAVYNGEAYVGAQIDSILAQSCKDWRLLVQDDASVDRTASIIESYAEKYPDKIFYERNEKNLGGAKENFSVLLQRSDAPYAMTCDHDDVWLPDKIEITFKRMQKLEKMYGKEMPLLIHTDLKVVDQNLQVISASMIDSQKLNPYACKLEQLLPQNHITGCTMMLNRALIELAGEIPKEAIMHDWYLALVAAAFGKIDFIHKTTILYRQHQTNEIGYKKVKSISYAFLKAKHREETKKNLNRTYMQAQAFLHQFSSRLSKRQAAMVNAYAQIPFHRKLERIKTVYQYRFFPYSFIRRAGQLYYI